jgi:hypothetical protein
MKDELWKLIRNYSDADRYYGDMVSDYYLDKSTQSEVDEARENYRKAAKELHIFVESNLKD